MTTAGPVQVVTERARRVLAPNPGPMTLDGTNTWVLAEPGAGSVVVVDPGPDDPAHLDAVEAAVAALSARVGLILITHRHHDHTEGAPTLARRTGAEVRAVDPGHRKGSRGLDDETVIEVSGLVVRVVATPGHTDDSVCLTLPADRALLTGDTVLGRGTAVVAHPDGRLGDYLESLERLGRVVEELGEGGPVVLLPGHGDPGPDAGAVVAMYRAHRQARLGEVRAALAGGAHTPAEVVAVVYAEVDPRLLPAAELSVRAQLEYLQRE